MFELVERYAPDRIVSLHQPASLIDYDGPARGLAEAMAAAARLPVDSMGARAPGRFGSWAGVDRGLPTVTVELPRSADRLSPSEVWRRYGGLLIEACRF